MSSENNNKNKKAAKRKYIPPVFIDGQDRFRVDLEAMLPWYSEGAMHIQEVQPPEEDVPFLVFIFGCEAALRCQQIDEVH